MPELMKLLRTTKCKMAKYEKPENVSHLEITEVVLVHCNFVNNDYQLDSRGLHTFIPNKSFGQLLDILLKKFFFEKPLIQSFVILTYGFLTRILNHSR